MDNYSFLRELADSWVLLAMTVFFLGTIIWAFRPGSRDLHNDISEIPFRHENAPAKDTDAKADAETTPNLSDEEMSK